MHQVGGKTGTLSSMRNWFQNPASKVSAHYGVGKDGSIEQYVEDQDTAFHAGTILRPTWPLLIPGVNPNSHTIGIEHEGTGNDEFTEPQLKASRWLVRELCAKHNIVMARPFVVEHRQIRADKSCPGKMDIDQVLMSFRVVEVSALRGLAGHINAMRWTHRHNVDIPSLVGSIDTILTLIDRRAYPELVDELEKAKAFYTRGVQ